ncbi:DUF1798 family protein [Bacillus sp. PK3_68]|uniref:DUF1798 family protein n=1 Tax=Bacillus sp. PK3_68 TaxID=2027408 RepID=UPI000E71DFB8|nr:DUF1798 family protein [Bacillus sp. PK3_68]RJS59505.1 hypothetical protein CJ483_05110 [Bacillus sp. PK3_68]
MSKLQELTEQLVDTVTRANDRYHLAREQQEKGDFYTEVKPFADKARSQVEEWEREISAYLKTRKFKHIHYPQVKAVVENIELISVQAFFPETSYKRFRNYVESTLFVLQQLLKELE